MPKKQSLRPGPSAYYGEKGWRFVRLWQTLMIVVEAEKPLSVAAINERLALDSDLRQFEGKHATTRDDLWVLVRCGFPILVTDETGEEVELDMYLNSETPRRGKLKNTRWSLRPGNDIGRLESPRHRRPTSAELTTLSLLRGLLQDSVPRTYPLFEQLQVLLDELNQWWSGHIRGLDRSKMIDNFLASGKRISRTSPDMKILKTVAECLRRERMVEGIYTLSDGREIELQVMPLSAWFSEGRAHLFAARGGDGALRAYRLDRFQNLQISASGQKPRIDQQAVERLLAGRFGGFLSEPQKIKLRANAFVRYLFDEYQFHPSQRVRSLKDGSLSITLNCAVSFALEEWILGFGEHMEVIEPSELRSKIATRLRQACEKYTDAP